VFKEFSASLIPIKLRTESINDSKNAFYFWHIPKTAGTSITHSLKENFSSELICPSWIWSQLLKDSRTTLNNYSLISGHFYSAILSVLDTTPLIITFLRDPLRRAISHFSHIKRFSQHYLNSVCCKLGTFDAFMSDLRSRPMVSNFQCRMLALSFDPYYMAESLSTADLDAYRLEQLIESMEMKITDDDLYEQAKERLERFFFVGITERYDDSIRLLAKLTGWKLKYSELNKNPNLNNKVSISSKTQNQFEELNKADYKLYKHAIIMFDSKFKDIGQSK
jgi:hypothetical protein